MKQLDELKKTVALLQDDNKKLQQSGGDTSKNFQAQNKAMELLRKTQTKLQNVLTIEYNQYESDVVEKQAAEYKSRGIYLR
jgi:hypothetical protein